MTQIYSNNFKIFVFIRVYLCPSVVKNFIAEAIINGKIVLIKSLIVSVKTVRSEQIRVAKNFLSQDALAFEQIRVIY